MSSSTLSGTLNSLACEGRACLTSTEGRACISLYTSNLYSDRVYGRVQRSSGRHSSTRNHLVCGGERVVLAMGLGRGSINNRPTVRLSRGANCIWRCSLCPRWHGMTAVVLSCTRAPLVSAHCSLSPDDVLGVLGWVHVCWVVSSCQC